MSNSSEKLIEVEPDEETRKQFIRFKQGDAFVYIKKMTLVWWLSIKERRGSTDRIYRFMSERKAPSSAGIWIGDYIEIMYGKKKHIVQVLDFRFVSGKKYYGDFYDHSKKTNDIEALCNFLEWNNGNLVVSKLVQRYINVTNYKKTVHVKRDLKTGSISLY